MNTFLEKVFNATLPYKLKKLSSFRMKLLQEMKGKSFSHYVNQMKSITTHISEIMMDDEKVRQDNYWETVNLPELSFKKGYWETESVRDNVNWIKEEFPQKRVQKGVTGATKLIFYAGPLVDQLIGEAAWMTPQQVMLFKTIVTTYFSSDKRLWPVNLNMDYVFETRAIQIKNPKAETEEEKNDRQERNRKKMERYEQDMKEYQSSDSGLSRPKYPNLEVYAKEEGVANMLLKAALAGAGPFVLKILQQINTSNESKIEAGGGSMAVADLTGDIFSNIPGLTKAEAQEVQSGLKLPRDQTIITNMNSAQLGSASIAEAHLSHSDRYDKDVVLKFVKPIYAYYFLCEVNFMLTKAWESIPKFARQISTSPKKRDILILQGRRLIMFFVKEFVKEFDYENEFINTTVGFEIYNEARGSVKSIVAIDYSINPFPCLALQRVKGSPVDKIMKKARKAPKAEKTKILARLYRLVDQLIKKWFKNTLWGNGFFHADLHPGNVMEDREANHLYLIDFGSAGQISRAQQCQLLQAMKKSADFYFIKPKGQKNLKKYKKYDDPNEWEKAHAYNRASAGRFVEAIWNLCQVEDSDEARDDSGVRNEKAKNMIVGKLLDYTRGLYFSTMFLKVAELSDSVGICISSDILMFGRAVAYIGNMIYQIHVECDSLDKCPMWVVSPIITRFMLMNPQKTYHCLVGAGSK